MAQGDQRSTDRPTLRAGFAGFAARDRWVNVTGSLLGVAVWLVTYWLAAGFIEGPVDAVVARAAVLAAAVTSVYYLALFVSAIGSPFGNLFGPALVTVGMPGPVYRILGPVAARRATDVVPFTSQGGVAIDALVVSLVVPYVLVLVAYWARRDVETWERRVMVDFFTLSGWLEAQASDGGSPFRPGTGRRYLRATTILVVLVLVLTLVFYLDLLPSGVQVSPADVTGTLLVVAFLLAVRFA